MTLTKGDFQNNMRKVTSEFVGTLILIVTIQLATGAGESLAALAIGLMLTGLIYALGPVSGCNINPAISLAMFMRGSLTTTELLTYWVAQFGGGFVGALVGKIVEGTSVHPAVGEGHNFLQAFLAELIFTAIFIFIILMVVPANGAPNPTFGITIGLTLFACVIAIGSISGACLNPAVASSLVLINKLTKLHYALWVALANAGGALVATFLYMLLYSEEKTLTPEEILHKMTSKLDEIKTGVTATDEETAPLV